MKNICIPNPTLYKITYIDSTGSKTGRTIVPISQTEDAITAYCYHSHGIRTFRKESIEAMTSTSEHPSLS
jgi:predicted DNA-binding transcriptional regulator YafY